MEGNELRGDASKVELFVKIDGKAENISPDTFFKVTKGMFEVMKDVDTALNNGQPSVHWEVTNLVKGSGAMTFGAIPLNPGSRQAEILRGVFVRGVRSIQERSGGRPPGFTDKALRKMRGIIATLPPDENILQVGDESNPVSMSMEAVVQIDQWLEARYTAVGSIEGYLENVAGHDRRHCSIYDRLNRRVECYFPDEMKQLVKDGLFERVAIRGVISYRADGTPISVRPLQIVSLSTKGESPRPRDLMGTWRMKTSSAEFVGDLHDE